MTNSQVLALLLTLLWESLAPQTYRCQYMCLISGIVSLPTHSIQLNTLKILVRSLQLLDQQSAPPQRAGTVSCQKKKTCRYSSQLQTQTNNLSKKKKTPQTYRAKSRQVQAAWAKLFQVSINTNARICRKIHGSAQGGKAAHVELLSNWMNGWSRRHLSVNEANPVSSTSHLISNASQVFNGNADSIQKTLTSAWVVDFPVGLQHEAFLNDWSNSAWKTTDQIHPKKKERN